MANRIVLFFLMLIAVTACSTTDSDYSGTCVSKDVVNIEAIRIMYSNGYYRFLSTKAKEDTLILRRDRTFIHSKLLCNKGLTKWSGKWYVDKHKVVLDYDDKDRNDMIFIAGYNQLYSINNIVALKTKKSYKRLCLLEKR